MRDGEIKCGRGWSLDLPQTALWGQSVFLLHGRQLGSQEQILSRQSDTSKRLFRGRETREEAAVVTQEREKLR